MSLTARLGLASPSMQAPNDCSGQASIEAMRCDHLKSQPCAGPYL